MIRSAKRSLERYCNFSCGVLILSVEVAFCCSNVNMYNLSHALSCVQMLTLAFSHGRTIDTHPNPNTSAEVCAVIEDWNTACCSSLSPHRQLHLRAYNC